jgi:hypothetical protein
MSPQERKQKLINEIVAKIENSFGDKLVITKSTCNLAPHCGWSLEEFMYMPKVAQILKDKGYTVTMSVNHGVQDWKFAV